MTEGTSRRERLRRAKPTGFLLVVIAGLFAVGTAITWLAVTHFVYASGLAGMSGHLKVEACTWSGVGGHRSPHCHGVFRSDDGTMVDPDATIDNHLSVGSVVGLRRTASGGYERTGAGAVFGWLAMSLFGLMVLVLGITVTSALTGPRDNPRNLTRLLAALLAATLASALIGGVADMAGVFGGWG
ncbi:hypothetical protein ACFYXJ_25155 [Streptomyces sp. NPDC002667]|uniref:hypothetical protein n=1 Tax=Streptomyces sp. NPDC002667 TaxID=3364657 RepID=UPI00369094A0